MNDTNTVITTVKVDRDKRDLAKARGLKLQEVLDIALDNILKIENLTNTDVLKEKEDTIKELTKVESDKEIAIAKLNNELINIKSSIKDTEKDYNIKIDELKLKIDTLDKNTTKDIFELDKIRIEENKIKEYNLLLDEFIDKSGDYKDENLNQKINYYSLVFTENKDFNEVLNKLNNDLMEKLRANKRNL